MPFDEEFSGIVWALIVCGTVAACAYDFFFRAKESA